MPSLHLTDMIKSCFVHSRSGLSPGQRLGLEAYLEGAEEVAAADAEKVHAKRKVQFRDCAPRGGCVCADRWSVV